MEIGSQGWLAQIRRNAPAIDPPLSDAQLGRMAAHARTLALWNRKVNLTAITDPADMAIKHFVDALMPLPLIPPRARLLDLGSGGGFPGIPLKIARPALAATLVDAVRKKVSFLKHVIGVLKLDGIEAIHGRAESLADIPALRGCFDIVISRALTALPDFVAWGAPFLAPGGTLIAMKGRLPHEELAALKRRRDLKITHTAYALPGSGSRRSIVTITLSAPAEKPDAV